MVGLALASLVLAYFSWRYVEQPFRRRPVPVLPGRGAVFGASLAGIAVFVVFGLSGYNQKGFPSRLTPGMTPFFEKVQVSLAEQPTLHSPCKVDIDNPGTHGFVCIAFDSEGTDREVAVFGDSHQGSLLPAFEQVAARSSVRVLTGAVAGCPPLLGVVVSSEAPVDSQICYNFVRQQAEMAVSRGVEAVVLVSRWLLYTTGVNDGKDVIALSRVGGSENTDTAASKQVFEEALTETIAFYRRAGIKVVIVQQVPEHNIDPRHVIERAIMLRQPTETARQLIQTNFTSRSDHEAKQAYVHRVFSEMAGRGVSIVSIDEAFADGGEFIWLADGEALYFDNNHLTVAGARRAGSLLAKEFEQVLAGR